MENIKFLNCKINLLNTRARRRRAKRGDEGKLQRRKTSSTKVFVPRPETEFWVQKAIKEIKKIKNIPSTDSGDIPFQENLSAESGFKILDIFAGSGCIGIAVLKACPESCQKVDFVDIDEKALQEIKINLKENNIEKERYRIIKSNIFENIKSEKYNIIFANPPYVALERISEVDEEVLENEPWTALFAGSDGMVIIERFLKEVKSHLKKNGIIYLEFDPFQKEKIKNILKKQGFYFCFCKDQFQKTRWVKIYADTKKS